MMRINIEASANVARFLKLMRTDEKRADALLYKAHAYLPLNLKHAKVGNIGKHAVAALALYLQSNGSALNDEAYRKMGNLFVNAIYRNNSPIEDIHAGRYAPNGLFTHRRLSVRQSDSVFNYIAHQSKALFAVITHISFLPPQVLVCMLRKSLYMAV